LNFSFVGCGCESFQVQFLISRNDGRDPISFPSRHQGLKDLRSRQTYFGGDRFGGEVVGLDFIFP
jgi:hypothetical protein